VIAGGPVGPTHILRPIILLRPVLRPFGTGREVSSVIRRRFPVYKGLCVKDEVLLTLVDLAFVDFIPFGGPLRLITLTLAESPPSSFTSGREFAFQSPSSYPFTPRSLISAFSLKIEKILIVRRAPPHPHTLSLYCSPTLHPFFCKFFRPD